MNVTAKITGISYHPFLCEELKSYPFSELEKALRKNAFFKLLIEDGNEVAVSWWVSAKRTRSYPYARVYNTLSFSGKKVTIIPVFKDEGKDGDRDFLQWDTVSLMSLLGIYVIIAYYDEASKNEKYQHKITKQRFNIDFLKGELNRLLTYHSDPLHWNLDQIEKIGETGQRAIEAYLRIARALDVEFHSMESAQKRVDKLKEGKEKFKTLSRALAKEAADRESITIQPKEYIKQTKGTITITNYLGGCYFFTADEIEIFGDTIRLIEAKHSKKAALPSKDDIKDGLIKMILYTNLQDVEVGKRRYTPIPVLKLTSEQKLLYDNLSENQKVLLEKLQKEAERNNFKIE